MKQQKTSLMNVKNLKLFFLIALIVSVIGFLIVLIVRGNKLKTDYVFETNAFFAPFEYYDGQEIVGVDIDIIKKLSTKMNKTIAVKDVEFDVIIDNVEAGKIADAGVAGLTVTDARKKKVDFSIPYYDSIQYILYKEENSPLIHDGKYTTWQDLSGKVLGSQTGGTGYLFSEFEIENASLKDTGTVLKGFDNHMLAVDAVKSNIVDYVVIDELPAKTISEKIDGISVIPLYYNGKDGAADEPVMEEYAIAVNKNQKELLSAINELLSEMLKKDASGVSEIDRLILQYSGVK